MLFHKFLLSRPQFILKLNLAKVCQLELMDKVLPFVKVGSILFADERSERQCSGPINELLCQLLGETTLRDESWSGR